MSNSKKKRDNARTDKSPLSMLEQWAISALGLNGVFNRGSYKKPLTWHDAWLDRIYTEYSRMILAGAIAFGVGLGIGLVVGRKSED